MKTEAAPLTTTEGDTLDEICWRHYQSADTSLVVTVLEANPGLLDYGERLPAGLTVTMPAQSTEPARHVRLWGVT